MPDHKILKETGVRYRPIVYVFANLNAKEEAALRAHMAKDGLLLRHLKADLRLGQRHSEKPDLDQIFSAIPLDELVANQHKIAGLVSDFDEWEKRAHNHGTSSAHSVIRTIFIELFRGIPFLQGSKTHDDNALANKWHVTLTDPMSFLRRGGNKCHWAAHARRPGYQHQLGGRSKIKRPWESLRRQLSFAISELHLGLQANPFAQQFALGHGDQYAYHHALLEGCGKELGLNEDTFRRILAHIFHDGAPVRIRKIMGDGQSGAAVFIAAIENSAPIIIKIATWLEAMKEFQGAQYVIATKLKNFVATSITPGNRTGPLLFEQKETPDRRPSRWGVIAYNIVGTPDESVSARSLREEIEALRRTPEDAAALIERLEKTLTVVVGRLHSGAETHKRPLWGWLGEVLPPLARIRRNRDGVVVENADTALQCWREQGLKPDAAALLAEAQLHDWLHTEENGETGYECSGFELCEFKDARVLVARHGDLGFRVEYEHLDPSVDLTPALYVRTGFPVDFRFGHKSEFQWVADSSPTSRPTARDQYREFLRLPVNSPPGQATDEEFKKGPSGSAGESIERKHRILNAFLPVGDEPSEIPFSLFFSGKAGCIHGDLNLANLLFSKGAQLGWMIDFSWSRKSGLIAYDYAKLEVELFQHLLIPEVLEKANDFASLFSDHGKIASPDVRAHRMLMTCLRALDRFGQNDSFVVFWKNLLVDAGVKTDLLDNAGMAYLTSLMGIAGVIRTAALSMLDPNRSSRRQVPPELAMALSAYAFVAIKFASKKNIPPLVSLLADVSEHYLELICPKEQVGATNLTEACCGHVDIGIVQQIDRRLLAEARKTGDFSDFTTELARRPFDSSIPAIQWNAVKQSDAPELGATKAKEIWDFASTGSVANITPIMGFLALMARAKASDRAILVPKISSKGRGGGTVDILESGGHCFIADIDEIKNRVQQEGGACCRQDEALVNTDKVTMERRRARNLMKNARLAFASILAKKVVMGCTHAVIDIKLGKDTKLILPQTFAASRAVILQPHTGMGGDPLTLCDWNGDLGKRVQDLICAALLDLPKSEDRLTAVLAYTVQANNAHQFLTLTRHCASMEKKGEKEPHDPLPQRLHIIATNADLPQCRAVGRALVLCHIHRLMSDRDRLPPVYEKLYFHIIPDSVELTAADGKSPKQRMREAWEQFQLSHLPKVRDGIICAMSEVIDLLEGERSQKHGMAVQLKGGAAISYLTLTSPYDYGEIKIMDAYELDKAFDELCEKGSGGPYDPDVGFWLHRLPEERCSEGQPLVTVFFRHSSHDGSATLNASIVKQLMWPFIESIKGSSSP